MTIRLEIRTAINVRPKRNEPRMPDGRLITSSILHGNTLDEVIAEARAARIAAEEIAPGHSEVVSVRAYDRDAFHADPFGCPPIYEAASL